MATCSICGENRLTSACPACGEPVCARCTQDGECWTCHRKASRRSPGSRSETNMTASSSTVQSVNIGVCSVCGRNRPISDCPACGRGACPDCLELEKCYACLKGEQLADAARADQTMDGTSGSIVDADKWFSTGGSGIRAGPNNQVPRGRRRSDSLQ
jgi:hypothetical protein